MQKSAKSVAALEEKSEELLCPRAIVHMDGSTQGDNGAQVKPFLIVPDGNPPA